MKLSNRMVLLALLGFTERLLRPQYDLGVKPCDNCKDMFSSCSPLVLSHTFGITKTLTNNKPAFHFLAENFDRNYTADVIIMYGFNITAASPTRDHVFVR